MWRGICQSEGQGATSAGVLTFALRFHGRNYKGLATCVRKSIIVSECVDVDIWSFGGYILWFPSCRDSGLFLDMGVLKWGYPQIIHFNAIFHYKPSSYWGIPIDGNPHLGPLWLHYPGQGRSEGLREGQGESQGEGQGKGEGGGPSSWLVFILENPSIFVDENWGYPYETSGRTAKN